MDYQRLSDHEPYEIDEPHLTSKARGKQRAIESDIIEESSTQPISIRFQDPNERDLMLHVKHSTDIHTIIEQVCRYLRSDTALATRPHTNLDCHS